MDKRYRFMNELFRIVNGALRLDIDKVRNYTAYLAEQVEKEGDSGTANRIRKLLSDTDNILRPTNSQFPTAVPVDNESRFALAERVHSLSHTEAPIILTADQWNITNEFIAIAKNHSFLETKGVHGAINLLLYGPPGTGKSRLARYISEELNLDLYIARLDGLISSYLGSTSKNIRALFDFASKTPCVLFLDEFDAIAKLRGDTQELGELKRVVNSFIQNLDGVSSHTIVVAATNHEGLLDEAIWRRFSYRIKLDYPTMAMRKSLWSVFLRNIFFADREIDILADLSEGMSGSNIEEVCKRLVRISMIRDSTPSLQEAFTVLLNISMGEDPSRVLLAQLIGMDHASIVSFLRSRNNRLYSHSAIANILGVSKSTTHRLSHDNRSY